ncbi:excinuclease ABC subunit C [Candidatus Tenderia electrophaga]|jgi:excinuclease ABC subunit C|uniref:UvrABC system protein C n=1 Tax=Candidatus Tenderia electrophaga TaxID=1748243 RepID=A0A0S2TDL7_9GAMM|nr:excinuclease ABC subunit C [Candidatus Tenderia electrophaga]
MSGQPHSADFDPKAFLKTLSSHPGVYRMLNAAGEVIYVGKARNLAKRVGSYFSRGAGSPKTRAMVSQIANIEVTVTNTENEALILENNLIKELRPRYNVLLRDDKSYPYIYISADGFPRMSFHRGAKRGKGRYFGPFPSAGAVRETLNLLQKVFRVRQCEDSFFRNRSRPCLQYQIKRCTAPCVGYVSEADYAEDVRHAEMFLEGRDSQVIDELVSEMERASAALAFEKAAALRDQIATLRRIQQKQYVSGAGGDLDIIVSDVKNGVGCVQVFFIRGGHHLGNKTFFPKHTRESDPAEVLGAFLPQYYLGKPVPAEVLVNQALEEQQWLESVLGEQAGRKVSISHNLRGDRARWLEMAEANLQQALARQLVNKTGLRQRYEALQDALGLDDLPNRLECFDISHTQGEATVASCVVFDHDGPRKSDYRRFNIEGITPGDDYGAMHQALTRRYTRLKKGEGKLPDILFIDGGKGQLSQARAVLDELQVADVALVGIAKGPERRPGLETLFLSGRGEPIILPADSPALHLIQQIRDEAHRFAITGHRQRRAKARSTSPLEGVPGVGAKRRRDLLNQFGGWQEVARAGVDDLARVKGVSRALAQRIYDAFHQD